MLLTFLHLTITDEMNILVTSRSAFNDYMTCRGINDDNVEDLNKAFFVSIHNSRDRGRLDPRVHFKREHPNVKVLYFDDVETEDEGDDVKCVPFDESMASEIIDFLESNRDKTGCIVHCTAGVSRSGAVGTFINDYFGQRHEEFVRANPLCCPNARVSRLLNKEMRRRSHESDT